MNKYIRELLSLGEPKIKNLCEEDSEKYRKGLGVFGSLICDEFFDLPKLNMEKRFSTDGLFFEIPYYDSEQLWESNNQIMLVVVYEIKNRSSYCPMRIDFKFDDIQNFEIIVYDQRHERTRKISLFKCVEGEYFTEIPNYDEITISGLLGVEK